MSDVLYVLIVDDDPPNRASGLAEALEKLGMEADAVEPEHVTREQVDRATLILVDFVLEEWVGEPPDLSPRYALIRQPTDGLAVAAVLRGWRREPCGFALFSAELERLAGDLLRDQGPHAVARLHGLEWAFAKDENLVPERVASLARAVHQIPESLKAEKEPTEQRLVQLLGLRDVSWRAAAERDLHAAQPPIHQLAKASSGLVLLRWLAQRILPYPTWLISDTRLATLLGLSPGPFCDALAASDALRALLEGFRYTGPLNEFLGRRWWRAGAMDYAVTRNGGSLRLSDELLEELSNAAGGRLEPLMPGNAVLCVDSNLRPLNEPVPRELAVRVMPDDWPVFAETAWMPVDALSERPELRQLIDPVERKRLERTGA